MADRVHPTAFGQIAIAERALAVLQRDGMTIVTRPSRLIANQLIWFAPGRVQRLRGDLNLTSTGTPGSRAKAALITRALSVR